MSRRRGLAAKAGYDRTCQHRRPQSLQKLRPFLPRALKFQTNHHTVLGIGLAPALWMGSKTFVYVLKNSNPAPHFYVGLTSNVSARVSEHNKGGCTHTASRRPWQVHVVIEFSDEARAIRFERYLKSGSGRAFAKRHFEG